MESMERERKYPLSRGLPPDPKVVKTFTLKESDKVSFEICSGSVIGSSKEAIVNACNRGGVTGFGLDEAMNKAAGFELKAERKRRWGLPHQGIKPGEARQTDAYGLKCRKILHATGPAYRQGPETYKKKDRQLRRAYIRCVKLAVEHNLRSVAFCPLSSSVFLGKRPLQDVLDIAINTVTKALLEKDEDSIIRSVSFVGYKEAEVKGLLEACSKCSRLV